MRDFAIIIAAVVMAFAISYASRAYQEVQPRYQIVASGDGVVWRLNLITGKIDFTFVSEQRAT
jgi:hypothetical protein